MKKLRKEKEFLSLLAIRPNISAACAKIGLSRNTVYRWKDDDEGFKIRLEEALKMGVESINDLSEGTVIGAIKEGNVSAARYWLDNHKKEYIKPRSTSVLEKLFPANDSVKSIEIKIIESKKSPEENEKPVV